MGFCSYLFTLSNIYNMSRNVDVMMTGLTQSAHYRRWLCPGLWLVRMSQPGLWLADLTIAHSSLRQRVWLGFLSRTTGWDEMGPRPEIRSGVGHGMGCSLLMSDGEKLINAGVCINQPRTQLSVQNIIAWLCWARPASHLPGAGLSRPWCQYTELFSSEFSPESLGGLLSIFSLGAWQKLAAGSSAVTCGHRYRVTMLQSSRHENRNTQRPHSCDDPAGLFPDMGGRGCKCITI